MAASRLHTFPLLTAADLEDTPSRRDGLTPGQEARLWRRMGVAIYETSKATAPPMSSGTASVAMTFVARFYSMKSLLRNHPPLIAAAALFLAGKVNDEPRSMRLLAVEFMKRWYGRENVELQRAMAAPNYSDSLTERMEEAEEMLMYTLKFDFDVTPLISAAMRTYIRVPALAQVRGGAQFQQFIISTGNDIMKRDAGIVLMFRPEEISLAIGQLYFKIERQHGRPAAALEPPPDPETGAAWYAPHGLSEERHRAILKRLQALYSNVEKQDDGPGAGTATASMGGAAASSGDVGAQSGHVAASAGGESKPGHASAQAGAGAGGGRRMVSIRQRTAAAKRPRSALEEEESQKAKQQYFYKPEPQAAKAAAGARGGASFSDSLGGGGGGVGSFPSSQHPYPGYAPSSQYSQLYSDLDAAPAGGYGGGHVAAPVPAPAPAAADDDELEEGEIEEGEIV